MGYTIPTPILDKDKIIYLPPVLIKEGTEYPKPPKPPLGRLIREGTIGDCPYCGSTTIKRWILFGRSIGCIQETCTNYYKRVR